MTERRHYFFDVFSKRHLEVCFFLGVAVESFAAKEEELVAFALDVDRFL
jgi:hypothetical protein